MNNPRDIRNIPEITLDSLQKYASYGVPAGSFLEAVLANDLLEAVACADEYNMVALPAIANYVYNEIPATCHGSRRVYRAWIEYQSALRNHDCDDEIVKKREELENAKYKARENNK